MPTRPRFPFAAVLDHNGLHVTFADIPPAAFVDSFSHETLARHPHSLKSQTTFPPADLARYANSVSGCPPAGLVMHTARVGSTLQVRLLRCIPGLTVYSEPPALNDLLMPPFNQDRPTLIGALRLVTNLMARHAGTNFLLKLRSWNTLFADLLIEAFPTTPWVFAVRDPVEVGVSVLRSPPTWLRLRNSANNPFRQFLNHHAAATPETYIALMFAAFCNSVAALEPANGLLVEYKHLPEAVWELVCPHLGFSPTALAISQMKAVSLFDAKCPFGTERLFKPDAAQKQNAASVVLQVAAAQIARPALRRLQEVLDPKALSC